METLKTKPNQDRKKSKRAKSKNNVRNCSYETLPQNVESLQLSDSEETLLTQIVCVGNDTSEESAQLLKCEGKDHLECPPNETHSSWDSSNENTLLQNPEISECIQHSSFQASLTELNEIKPSVSQLHKGSYHADTAFESPIHLPPRPSTESPLDLWIESNEETEIANEACPSAPVLQSSSIDVDVNEVTPTLVLNHKPFFPFVKEKENNVEEVVKPFTLSQLTALYHNQELEAAEDFVTEFIETELRRGDIVSHPLYELLSSYQRARAKLSVNNTESVSLRKVCQEHQFRLWTLEKCLITESGECQDGNPVEASHEFQTAHFNKTVAANLSRSLSSLRELISESYALSAYTCEVIKLQVDHFIQQQEAQFSLPHNAPVTLSIEVGKGVVDLKEAVSVLFAFQRHSHRDEGFIVDCRNWLTRLIAVLLRVATWREHLFLLHHVLRCPGGVSKWATSFIQLPISSHSPQHLDHLVTCLACVLQPVKARDLFLSQMTASGDITHAWVVIDSDGEDEPDANGLRETDIVCFLNQVPFGEIFRQVIDYNGHLLTEDKLLKLIALCSLLLNLLGQGLNSESANHHHQYAKRLGRLIRHTMQYVTDQYQLFRNEGEIRDYSMLRRLTVEYDAMVTRAVHTLYHSPGHSSWQFLAVLPFDAVSTHQLWAFFRFLLLGDDEPVDEERWHSRLGEQLKGLSDAEIYYLLTAVHTMALSRSPQDWSFIEATTLQLLEIGFLNPVTRDTCFKSARIMLVNLTAKHPKLISKILEWLNISSNCGKLCCYLMKELPVALWCPSDVDISILEMWLLQSTITSVKSVLARYVISGLNLGYNTNDLSHELFLARSVHVNIAMLILKVAVQFCPQAPPEGTTISATFKQVTGSLSTGTSPEQTLLSWLWQMALRLRLHLLDQSDASVQCTMANPSEGLSAIPDIESGAPEVELITKHLKSHQAMAVYMSLQMTSLGHCVPLIFNRGFALLSVLQSCHLHTAVISLLQHLVPLFLDCPNMLVESDKFRSIVLSLLSADRTFFKSAKSLISKDPPGEILQQFGDMIQYHLENYSRYNLMSCTPLAQLWFQSLCIVWSEEPSHASYLMDVVLSSAFFRPEISAMAYDNLSQLLQTLISTTQANSRLSSLFSWVSGSNNGLGSLVPQGGSYPQAPWFAYFALHVEELNTQGTNGVWQELVKELALNKNKHTVDTALKKATTTLKVTNFPSSALSIYRWGQQLLDTSVDHPALPLLWQKFFTLCFTRYVSLAGVDHGSVGDKLFEGMTYLSFHKRLKRKLRDCGEYYHAKAAVEDVTSEKYLLYDTLSKLYETFLLWIDEPRLHEPSLYMPALPPQYNAYKLIALTSSADQTPWFEFVDYEKVRTIQNASIHHWLVTQGRVFSPSLPPPSVVEESDPVQRIHKRLGSYENPVPPPPLRTSTPVVPPINQEALLNKTVMLDALEPSFKALLQYAQSHSLRMSEHKALDCRLMELLPALFLHMECEVTLHAACDTAEPRTQPPQANALNCAGPAVIHIKVCPASVNNAVKQEVETNRSELDTVLKYSLQSPPSSVCIASVHIEHATQALERECQELKTIGDIRLLESVRDVGITLFYHMCKMYAEDVVIYPPLRQLITSCVQILGDSFISCSESECTRLLTAVLSNPHLSGLMCPHFTPSVASPATFIHMYCILVDSDRASSDLLFVLLSKFDVAQWLREHKPRLSERSQIIELAGKALVLAGHNPASESLMLHGVYRHHLSTLFMYDFPEHYGEVLSMVLRHSETQCLAPDIWYDLVNALAGARCQPGLSLAQLKEIIHKYATEQRVLSLQELKDTSSMLGSHFTKERLQYGLYGLYPKYRLYTEPLATLQGMIAHAFIVATLHNDRGSLSEKLCDQMWPPLCGLFSPWLAPYYTRHLPEPAAAWIQQLTDDRSVLTPWVVADAAHAHLMVSMFVECIRFVLDTLPVASSHVLSSVWQFYVTSYAHSSVKEHVLNIVHSCFATLPWSRLQPSLQDIDLMLKVVDQYLPVCHVFLGMVFIEVSWPQWVSALTESQPPQVSSRVHAALLHLLIKLANEPNVRQSGAVTQLLIRCQQLSWHLVECSSYEPVVNWFIMSYDPRVVLQTTGDTDLAALDLLEVAAGYTVEVTQFHFSTPRKRQVYVRACVKLLLNCLNRFKQLASNPGLIKAAVRRIVDRVETVITATGCIAGVVGPQRVAEAGLLLTEVLALVTGPVATLALEAIEAWLSTRSTSSVVVVGLLRVLPLSVMESSILGNLLEATLAAYFRPHGEAMGTWSAAVENLQPLVPRHPPLEDSLVTDGHLLSLYIVILKCMPTSLDTREEANILNSINQWLPKLTVSEKTEAKLPLLWSHILFLCCRQCEYSLDPMVGVLTLRNMAQSVTQFLEHRAGAGWGILGAIGLVKSNLASNRFRVMSRFLVALVLAQMPDSKTLFVRFKPHAPGSFSATNGDYSVSADSVKAITALESLAVDKNYLEWKITIEYAARLVRQPENSLHNANQLVLDVARHLYTDCFLHNHTIL